MSPARTPHRSLNSRRCHRYNHQRVQRLERTIVLLRLQRLIRLRDLCRRRAHEQVLEVLRLRVQDEHSMHRWLIAQREMDQRTLERLRTNSGRAQSSSS